MPRPAPPRSILITGASSGLGEALARHYAGPGIALHLNGRDATRLEEVAALCRAAGATVATRVLDVTERESLAAWIDARDRETPLDLVIANAGVSAGTGRFGESEAQARHIFAVNVDGVVNTVLPAIAAMRPRGRGQIAIMASLAAFRGFPGAPAYCGSKAAVRVWGESLRGEVERHGISVSVICPGYVRSRMTAVNTFPMPLLMDAERAATIIARRLARGRGRIAFPWPIYFAVWLIALLPTSWTDNLLAKLPKKAGAE
ncbi:SDR family NAD(P)-dependent oxidoreductase [Roseiterribacter gracilis]|uniref:Short-chain dehydrogenase n=1 Tax=Roseiterribacter gracilis TaxID=2812848 RepID=A0A8S8XDX3_9PROT|nr:short-chain dehydrogenase [Rhodospirillales bacterium TMPK1]